MPAELTVAEAGRRGARRRIVVAGGGGFIGGHLVAHLIDEGEHDVLAVDAKPLDEWYQVDPAAENRMHGPQPGR